VNTQVNTTLFNKQAVRWLAIAYPDEPFLEKLSQKYQDKFGELPKFEDPKLKREIARLLEAIMWIYYLGKPQRWGYERYSGGGYTTDLDKDLEWVFAFQVRLPRSLFNYLLTEFTVPGTDDNFLDHARKRKEAALGAHSGYGIEKRDPSSGWEWQNYAPHQYIQSKPDKPIDDPSSVDYNAYDLAAYQMIEWFKQLEKFLAESERQLSVALTSKGIQPVPSRDY
jgi:hypothetical protein